VARFVDAERDQPDRDEGRRDGEPQHCPNVVGGPEHQQDGQQGPKERADSVHRLTQPKARAANLGRSHICHQRIARRAADPLADTVKHATRDNQGGRGRQGE